MIYEDTPGLAAKQGATRKQGKSLQRRPSLLSHLRVTVTTNRWPGANEHGAIDTVLLHCSRAPLHFLAANFMNHFTFCIKFSRPTSPKVF